MRTGADLVEGSAASVGISRIPSWALDRERADPAQPPPLPLRLAALGTDGANPIPMAPLMRVSEAAAVLRVSTKTIRRLIAKGDLQVVRVGRSVRLRQEEINCYISKPSSNSKY
jgi:excisionase family DNA binding protein